MRYPKSQATTDPKAIAEDVVQEVFAILRSQGVRVPLSTMAAVIASVEERYGEERRERRKNGTAAPAQEGQACP